MSSYEDYEREYNADLSRIRSYLAGTRSTATLTECERLLSQAKKSATAMVALAEVEGSNALKIKQAQQRLEREIAPLAKEVERALHETGREELFYQAPTVDGGGSGANGSGDMESLIGNSEALLRESQALCMETEQIGNSTLSQMGRQREQLTGANANIEATREIALQAKAILTDMGRRAWKSKVALYVMIGILVILNIQAIKHIFRSHHHSSDDDDDS